MDKINDFLAKVKIPVASHGRYAHKFSFPILETSEWMTAQPIYTRELRKGDSIEFKSGLFGRTDALLHPAFVTGSYHYRSFFVPYRLLQPSYQHMMERTRYTFPNGASANVETTRYFNMKELEDFILTQPSLVVDVIPGEGANIDNFDIVKGVVGNSSFHCYNWTALGVRFVQLMNGLGYNFEWTSERREVDALPLLSWLCIYRDWFFPDQYAEIAPFYLQLDQIIKFNSQDLEIENFTVIVPLILGTLKLYYLDDTLSSVWDTPGNAAGIPQADSSNMVEFPDISLVPREDSGVINEVSTNTVTGNPTIHVDGGLDDVGPISQFMLNTLSAVQNWLQRRKLSGGRVIERYLASHGQTIPAVEDYTCLALGHKVIPIQVGDVENNSNTNTGELAGKGIVRTQGKDDLLVFDCTAKEDGLFVIVRYIMPEARIPMYEHPALRKIACFNRFHNEFQKTGMEVVPSCVIYRHNSEAQNNTINKDFGFAPTYWWESAEFPRLLGDFTIRSRGARQLEQMHTFRTFMFGGLTTSLHHSLDFISTYDRYAFNRIFYNGEGSNFRNYMFCSVVLKNEKLPNGDSFDWDDDELNRRVELISKSNV